MKITKHYPGFIDTVNSDYQNSGEFNTKKELLNIPFVKEWMKENWNKNNHWEIELNKSIDGITYAYLMEVSNDLSHWWIVGIITRTSNNEEVKIMKNWFPQWNYSNMKPIKELQEVKIEY